MRSLQIFRLGFAAPGKQASGLFSARTGRQALETKGARGKSVQGVVLAGEEFPRQQVHAFMREP